MKLKKILVNSPLGDWYRTRRDITSAQTWDSSDDRRSTFYSEFVKEGDLVFDIGANIGNRTRVFRRLGAMVIALEPQPHCQSILAKAFGNDPKVTVVTSAVGAEEGTAQMAVAKLHGLSSLSSEWLNEVKKSQRFGEEAWDKTITCKLTTLQNLMTTYGVPSFMKIDVEGYELQVIKGMHSPVAALSFEFTPEYISAAFECIDRLESLGMTEFNYSIDESMQFDTPWCGKNEVKVALQKFSKPTFGDVYARTLKVN